MTDTTPGTGFSTDRVPLTVFLRLFTGIMLPMFLAGVDATIVAAALPDIAATLGHVERISWVVAGYLVAATIAAPIAGRLGDAYGRRGMLVAAIGLFATASVLCAISTSAWMLIFMRVVQGFAGGAMMTQAQALIGEAVPPRQRGRFQGWIASVFLCSSTLGPILGGILTHHLGWRAVFLVNLPLCALAMLLALRLEARPGRAEDFRFDWLGTVLFAACVVAFMLALDQVRHFNAASVLPAAALMLVAAVAARLLLKHEWQARSPLLAMPLLSRPSVWRPNVIAVCVGGMLVGMVSFVPLWLSAVRGVAPDDVGFILAALSVGIPIGAFATGTLIARTGYTMRWPSFGMPVTATIALCIALFSQHIPTPWLPVPFLMLAISLGTAMPSVQTTVQTASGPALLGQAAASVQFSRSIGAASGTAIMGTVLFATMAAGDPAVLEMFRRLVNEGPGVLAALPADQRAVLAGEIGGAFRAAFGAVAVFAAIAATMAWTAPLRRV